MKKIDAKSLNGNVFSMLDNQWALLTAGDAKAYNTMTVSWGGLGVLWNKNVATVYVRPQRYTLGFIENSDFFTLSFFDEAYKSALKICGAKSGKDTDKIKEAGLSPVIADDTVYFDGAQVVLVCKKIYKGEIDPKNFLDETIDKNYANKDYHKIFIGEIKEVLIQE